MAQALAQSGGRIASPTDHDARRGGDRRRARADRAARPRASAMTKSGRCRSHRTVIAATLAVAAQQQLLRISDGLFTVIKGDLGQPSFPKIGNRGRQ